MTAPELLDALHRALARPAGPSSDFDLNADFPVPQGLRLRPAGVLVPLLLRDGAVRVILTQRSSRLKHHPGQVAFPGGKLEPGDRDATDAALREAEEEIGLSRGDVQVLGTLPAHQTVTNFTVTPVLGQVSAHFTPRAEAGEVAEVFEVPLAHLMALDNFVIERRLWCGVWRHYYTVPYGPYYIWGATARILHGLAERFAP